MFIKEKRWWLAWHCINQTNQCHFPTSPLFTLYQGLVPAEIDIFRTSYFDKCFKSYMATDGANPSSPSYPPMVYRMNTGPLYPVPHKFTSNNVLAHQINWLGTSGLNNENINFKLCSHLLEGNPIRDGCKKKKKKQCFQACRLPKMFSSLKYIPPTSYMSALIN